MYKVRRKVTIVAFLSFIFICTISFNKVGAAEISKVGKDEYIEDLSNTKLMSETGITVGDYDQLNGEHLYTIRFRDSVEISDWLSRLYITQSVLELKEIIIEDEKTFLQMIAPKHPLEFVTEYYLQSVFEMDNGYNLVQASLFMPLKNEYGDFPKKIVKTFTSNYLKTKNLDNTQDIFNIVTGKMPEITESAVDALNIDFDKLDDARAILTYLLIDSSCPNYVYDKAIFYCEGKEIARMPIYSKDITNYMGYTSMTPFDTRDIQFKSSYKFHKIGNEEPPEFTAKNLKLFIYDTFNLLNNKTTQTKIQKYVQEVFNAYNGEKVVEWSPKEDNDKIFHDYEFEIPSKYKDKIVFKQEERFNLYYQDSIGLYYHDTELAKKDIPLVFISKVSKKDWENNNLKSWMGPHERADMKGEWVYIWSLPGEHPYEPYGLDHFEAKEYSAIFEEILKVLEGPSDNASTAPAKNNESFKKVFEDVNSDHYAYEAILWAKEKGIVNGYSNGKFGPNDKVTEAQFAAMITNFFELQSVKGSIDKRTPNVLWSDEIYNSLAAYGVPLNGYFDNSIRNKPVKRGTVAQALVHLAHRNQNLNNSIKFLLDNNISAGQNPNDRNNLLKYFGYTNELTRAQAVTFLYKMQESDFNQVSDITESIFTNSNAPLNNLAEQSKAKVHEDLRASLKEEYLKKLNNVEKSLSEFDSLIDTGVTSNIYQAVAQTYKRWDSALTDVYSVLKTQLSTNEFNNLEKEQKQWKIKRDKSAEKAASDFKGGSWENVIYLEVQSDHTKERCYELVKKYLK